MKSFISFTKKEFSEHFRTGKFFIITGIFIVFAIMSPVLAYITPMVVEAMSQGSTQITVGEVTAMDSWLQFLKNAPMILIVFGLIESNIFTKEYQSGTLVLALTKGLKRHTVLLSKTFILLTLWTAEYFMCYGLTYFINGMVWDNSVAENLGFMAVGGWLVGILAISLMVLFSAIAKNNILVLAGTGGIVFGAYLIGNLPEIGQYMPTVLMNTSNLIYGLEEAEYFVPAIIITSAVSLVSIVISIPVFNKKYI